ncbi:M20 aminoacylase family protein [Paenirhodobacter populi]|uniref:M20 aminoacylase family protein n=1 Tax=Paenirhodobacter populi TaxID=2306993 RepID=UPI000FE4254A|nr:M20 aminoacylase family protein [Sinirhodobacter populi]RWR05867.1 amidohydrolase [Sinirhodobacter populi]
MLNDNASARVSDFDAMKDDLVATRHYLHQHPELSHQEANTARYVAEKLESWGYDVTRNVGGHGVVARLTVGDGRKSVAIRADMDALPITEAIDRPYKSQTPGVMHACGHDGHTTMLLGAAQYLARTRRFNGTLTLIFQPAEEAGTTSGAMAMIRDGLFERFPFDAIFGLHNHPGAPEGQILTRNGGIMAAADTARVTVKGKGGHASRPHLTVDPIMVACQIVVALQAVVSRSIDPTKAAVITVGTISGGTVSNVIPDTATFVMTVRSFEPEVRLRLEERILRVATDVAHAFEAEAVVEYEHGHPVVFNSTSENEFATGVARDLIGAENVKECPPIPGSEDFAHYLEHRPGAFLRLGNGVDSAVLHNPKYDFADESLTVGAALWARLAESYLR